MVEKSAEIYKSTQNRQGAESSLVLLNIELRGY